MPTDRTLLLPSALNQGGLIGVAAPSGPFPPDRFEAGLARLQSLGFRTFCPPAIFDRLGFLAGPDRSRAATLNALFTDPGLDAVIGARGGYGALRLLDLVDFQALVERPRPVIGFSDLTALLLDIHRRTGLVVFHGPVVTSLAEADDQTLDHLFRLLTGRQVFPLTLDPDRTVVPGRAEGPLLGGNLTLIVHLLAAGRLPDLDGAILFLEDTSEPPYKLDRKLTTLRLAGVLDRCRGVILGHFDNSGASEEEVEGVLTSFFHDFPGPVTAGFPAGHGQTNLALPLGPRAALDTNSETLDILEPYLA